MWTEKIAITQYYIIYESNEIMRLKSNNVYNLIFVLDMRPINDMSIIHSFGSNDNTLCPDELQHQTIFF